MLYLRIASLSILTLLLVACAGPQVQQCPAGTQNLPNCPPANAINDQDINKLYESRTWVPSSRSIVRTPRYWDHPRMMP